MPAAPPVADTKKPAAKQPEKQTPAPQGAAPQAAGPQAAGKQGPAQQGKQAKEAKEAKEAGQAGAPSAAGRAPGSDQAAAQQRLDRLAIRPKLSVSQPADPVEHEADRVADQVVKGMDEAPSPVKVQRRPVSVSRAATTSAAAPGAAAKDKSAPPPGPAADDLQSRLASQAGQGQGLPQTTQAKLEGQFGRDLSAVRIHTDGEAQAMTRQLQAEAFTVGNDIYFAQGRYSPQSPEGLRLLAHELTHVAQQESSPEVTQLHRKKSGTTASPPAAPGASATAASTAGAVDHAAKTITIPSLPVPSYGRKAAAIPQPLNLPKNPTRPNDQRQVFSTGVQATGGYADSVKKAVKTKRGVKSAKTGEMIHVLKPRASDTYIIGDIASLPGKVSLPRWNKSGAHSSYDVDHIREMQLGGTNTIDNMEMLDSSANRSSGSLIHNAITSTLSAAIAPEVGAGKHWKKAPDLKKVQAEYQVTYTATSPTLTVAGNPANHWSVDDLSKGEHVQATETLTAAQIHAKHLVGDDTHLIIYPRAAGGGANTIAWNPTSNAPAGFNGKGIFRNFEATGITYTPGSGGSITGTKKFGKDLLEEKTVTWKLAEMDGLDYTVYVDRSSVLASVATATLPGASPVSFTELDLDDSGSLTGSGVLRPSLPLLAGLELDLTLSADQVWLSKTFNGAELQFPGPISVMGSTLTVSAGTGGLKVEGLVDYEITRLGKGQISGLGAFGGSTGAGFGIKGHFELDKKVFDGEARIEAGYENDAFWTKGHLSIGEGKIQGIQSASIDAAYAKDTFSATGTVIPKIPAVDSASLAIEYSEAAGLKFAGDVAFKGNPLISEGKLHVEAAQPAGADGFKVKGQGSAKPNIPGIDSQLSVLYDDGAFDASWQGAYAKGMMSGQVSVGVTNRAVDAATNQPSGAADPNGALLFYGSGSATLKLAPWLQGTAGIKFAPNGEVTVSGEIALPNQINLFERKEIDKTLFSVATQIPIVPGVVAEVGGSLKAKAGIGPGALDQLRIGIEYNPAREEDTHVTGDAHLNVPGDAGLRLAARAGIGLGITGASATGGIELGGSLGIDGAAEASVHVDWTPRQGLAIDAEAAFHAEPKFKFDVSGYVAVTALGFSVYDNSWELAAYELGSNLRFGVKFPVKYREGEPFAVSLDDVQFEVPEVDPGAMIGQLADEIF